MAKLVKAFRPTTIAAIEDSIRILKARKAQSTKQIKAIRQSIETDTAQISMLETALKLQGSTDRVDALLRLHEYGRKFK
jgi:acetolactate synthase small subunit